MNWNPCYIEFVLYIETFHYIVRRHFEIPKKKVGTKLSALHTPVVRIVVAINNSCCINLNVDWRIIYPKQTCSQCSVEANISGLCGTHFQLSNKKVKKIGIKQRGISTIFQCLKTSKFVLCKYYSISILLIFLVYKYFLFVKYIIIHYVCAFVLYIWNSNIVYLICISQNIIFQ